MKQMETEILIHATTEKVWQILTDFENYPIWNPFILSISGKKAVGEKLKVYLQAPEGKGMTFTPIVLEYSENKEFRWLGKLGMKGIFDGEHYFILKEKGHDKTLFIHGERFSGILVPLFRKTLEKTKNGFQIMNESLKTESEKPI